MSGRRNESRRKVFAANQESVKVGTSGPHAGVEAEDQALRAVRTVFGDVVVLEATILGLKCLHEVVNVFGRDSIQMEEVRIQLGSDDLTARRIPRQDQEARRRATCASCLTRLPARTRAGSR
jgi:hypothetical protein